MNNKLIIHCKSQELYDKIVKKYPWYDSDTTERWPEYGEKTAIRIEFNKARGFGRLEYYKENNYSDYTFLTAEEVLNEQVGLKEGRVYKVKSSFSWVESIIIYSIKGCTNWSVRNIPDSLNVWKEDHWDYFNCEILHEYAPGEHIEHYKFKNPKYFSELSPEQEALAIDDLKACSQINQLKQFNYKQPNGLIKKSMSIIKDAFTSVENKALSYFNLGTTEELTEQGLTEFTQFVFETGTTDKLAFFAKIVEAYKEKTKK